MTVDGYVILVYKDTVQVIQLAHLHPQWTGVLIVTVHNIFVPTAAI